MALGLLESKEVLSFTFIKHYVALLVRSFLQSIKGRFVGRRVDSLFYFLRPANGQHKRLLKIFPGVVNTWSEKNIVAFFL